MWILGLKGLSRQLYFQLISVLEFFFFYIPAIMFQNTTWILCLCLKCSIVRATVSNSFLGISLFFFITEMDPLIIVDHEKWHYKWECQSSNPLCIPFSRWLLLLGIPQNLTQQTIFQSVCLNLIQISSCNLNTLKLIPTLKK